MEKGETLPAKGHCYHPLYTCHGNYQIQKTDMGITCSWQKKQTKLSWDKKQHLATYSKAAKKKKKGEWKCQLQASEVYLHRVLVTVQWTLNRVTNCRSMTSHSLPGIRNKQSSWFFITCAKPEDTLTRKASGNHFPHRESTFTDWRATVHCILTTTTPGLQD